MIARRLAAEFLVSKSLIRHLWYQFYSFNVSNVVMKISYPIKSKERCCKESRPWKSSITELTSTLLYLFSQLSPWCYDLLEAKGEMFQGSELSKTLSQMAQSNMCNFLKIYQHNRKTLQRRELLKTLFQRIHSNICTIPNISPYE